MYINPDLFMRQAKERHNALLAEAEKNRMIKKAFRSSEPLKHKYFTRIMIFTADLFIKIGVRMKKYWATQGDEFIDCSSSYTENK